MKIIIILILLLAGCTTTEYMPYESRNPVIQGNGGAKSIVDGIDFWTDGDPPRTFKLIGIIDDSRTGGIIPRATMKGDIARKAKEAGGDAVIAIKSESQITGYLNNNLATANVNGNSVNAYSIGVSSARTRKLSKFAVIKYMD